VSNNRQPLFVLRGTVKVFDEESPVGAVYDPVKQFWVTPGGEPYVCQMNAEVSKYGETTLTATIEGADQSEVSGLASTYGETVLTRTAEGVDTSEGSPSDSLVTDRYE
jgi:putative ATP-grasp target RiPP